ncbi:MAG: hypothetical protein IJ759_06105 [Bacteroidales bacterium]|nr:hypothetical protein [Bacteroidales bacterium]
MGIRFRKNVRKYMDNGVIKEKYFAKILSEGTVPQHRVTKLAENDSTMASFELDMAISIITLQLKRWLALGFTVDLGELGRFKPGITATPCDNPDDVNVKSISKIYINYKPGKELLQHVQQTKLIPDRHYDEYGQRLNYTHTKNPTIDKAYEEELLKWQEKQRQKLAAKEKE